MTSGRGYGGGQRSTRYGAVSQIITGTAAGGRAIFAPTPTSRRWTRGRVGAWLGVALPGLLGTGAQGQGALGIDPTGGPGTVPPLKQEELQPTPQLPPLVCPLPPLPAPSEASPGEHVFVREIRVTGSTVFS